MLSPSERRTLKRAIDPEDRDRQVAVTLARWRLNPCSMVEEEFGVDPDDWQAEGLQKFADPTVDQVAMIASMGVGKSAEAAFMTWNFVATRPGANVAVTSITGDNLKDGLWKELRVWWKKSKFLQRGFKFVGDRIYCGDPESWFISARKWKKGSSAQEQEETLRGLHARHVMAICDEAGCVPQPIVDGMQGIRATAGQEAKLVILGNPIVAAGPLWNALRDPLWHTIRVTGDPDSPRCSSRVDKAWAREQIRRLGRNNPWVQANVIGEFPTNISEGVLTLEQVEEAIGRESDNVGGALATTPRTLGLDVARRGRNSNVLIFREGDYVREIRTWQGVPTTETAGKLIDAIKKFQPDMTFVDDLGIGGAVVDICHAGGYPVYALNVCEAARRPEAHANLRSELAEHLQERFVQGRISLPEEVRQTTFAMEATSLLFSFNARGARRLEDKDTFIRRSGMSPDTYDGIAAAFADGTMATVAVAGDEVELARGRFARSSIRLTTEVLEDEEDRWKRRRLNFGIGRQRRAS